MMHGTTNIKFKKISLHFTFTFTSLSRVYYTGRWKGFRGKQKYRQLSFMKSEL